MAALDGVGGPDPDRDGQARPAGPGAGPALRACAARRADARRRQEARTHPRRRRAAHPRRSRRATARAASTRRRRRTVGWEYVHVAIDDATRLAYVEVLADEKAITAIGFLRRALAFYTSYGITVERLITDNGSRLPLDRPRDRLPRARHPPPPHPTLPPADQRQGRALHPHHARRLGLRRHLPRQPERTAALPGWLDLYNHRRPHGALGHQPPIARLTSGTTSSGLTTDMAGDLSSRQHERPADAGLFVGRGGGGFGRVRDARSA